MNEYTKQAQSEWIHGKTRTLERKVIEAGLVIVCFITVMVVW